MRLIDRISTAWTPYAVTFSHDGTRLAIGGGTWYGLGGITLIDLRTRERSDVKLGELDPEAFAQTRLSPHARTIAGTDLQGGSVSGLAFTSDDRHLFATGWLSGHGRGLVLALEVDGLQLRPIARHIPREGYAVTGLYVHRRGVALRRWRAPPNATVEIMQWPAEHDIDAARGRPELTNQRVVVANGHMITGSHRIEYPHPQPLQRGGLLMSSLGADRSGSAPKGDADVTALCASGDLVLTGDADGALEAKRWDGNRLVLDRVIGVMPIGANHYRAVYVPSAVTGICALGARAVAVTAGGMLSTWTTGEMRSMSIGGIGSRTIAASPDRSVVAIGVKDLGDAIPESCVVMVELESEVLEASWTTARARQVAAAFDNDRPLDAATLSVLADVLEEQGAPSRVLHHLRTHDRRLCTCWVVDQLREVLPSR